MADEWLTYAPIIISVVGAGIAGGGLFFNGYGSLQNAKSRYVQTMREFSKQIAELEASQERNNDHDLFGAKYLAVHDQIASLANKKAIPKKLARYFDSNFEAAYGLLRLDQFKHFEPDLTDFMKWVTKNKLKPGSPPMPHKDVKPIACNAQNPADAKFCNRCGKSVSSTCSKCKKANAHGASFCAECGLQLT